MIAAASSSPLPMQYSCLQPLRQPQKTWLQKVSLALLAVGTVLVSGERSPAVTPSPAITSPKDVTLQIGVVQRFGRKPTDTMILQASEGDKLTIRIETEGKPQTLTGNTAKFELVMQPLSEPKVEERLVFSTHRSFETAEDNANRWRSPAIGIPVELAQPNRWQVWAKREVYNTPLLRRLLLQSLQAQGMQTAHLDTQVLLAQPRASLVINGYRYTRDQVEITTKQGVIRVSHAGGKRAYAGSLRLQPNAYGTYTLVNLVPLEAYLRGVVPHEIGTWAPQPVLETQAILARTYALRNLRRFLVDGYQLCADTQCQVYNGLEGTHPATDRAIANTRGKVLTYQSELVDAVYSSTTGGVTAAFNDVWHGSDRPYLKAVVDSVGKAWDLSRKSLADEGNFRAFIRKQQGFNEDTQGMFRWRVESPLTDMNQELRQYLTSIRSPLANFKTIQKVTVTARASGGRVQKLQVTTDRGVVELEKDDVLNAFDAPNSLLFYVDPIKDVNQTLTGYAFVGGGLGHGVGLSQTGAYHLGKLGWSSDRILNFYYPGTQLQTLSDKLTFWKEK